MVTDALEIRFKSNPENIALVEKFIENVCQEYKIEDEAFGNIFIGLTEAGNNAIHHGNKADDTKEVVMRVDEKTDDAITFFISDQGEGFDPESLPDPTAPENLEKPTGRGVFLMGQLSEEMTYNEKGDEVKLKFKLN